MASSLTGKEYTVYRGIDGKITPTKSTIPALGPRDVLIKITHTGVCYTDREAFRLGAPLALGHEGVGIVEAIGSEVSELQVGDRAGGGFHRASCGHCSYCLTGNDIWCYQRTIYTEGDFDNGTFGEYYIGKETFVHKIPAGLSSEHAAPLQCAGATVYAALVYHTKPTDRIGIIGMGGLGHLAIQFASKLGAEVVVFSTTKSKEDEAREFGAKEFLLLDEVDKLSVPVSALIIAGNHYPDWKKFLVRNVLARDGVIIPLSAPTHGAISLPADRLFWDGYHVKSSLVASRQVHRDMLNFAARNRVKPMIEVYPHDGSETVTSVIEKLESNSVRYRAVLAAKA